MRLRATALPLFFPAINATRPLLIGERSPVGSTIRVNPVAWKRRPRENKTVISVPDLMVSTVQMNPLHAEALASFGATSSQHGTAALGGHASAEAVAHSPLVGIGLISALHVYFLYFRLKRATSKL